MFFHTKMIIMQKLVGTGAHLACRTTYSNFQPYLYGFRNKIAIIDLENTLVHWRRACNILEAVTRSNGNLLLVNTNPEYNQIVQCTAKQIKQSYMNSKWIGGLLTNWNHMQNVQRHFVPFANRSELQTTSQYSQHQAVYLCPPIANHFNTKIVDNTLSEASFTNCNHLPKVGNTQTVIKSKSTNQEWRHSLESFPQFQKMQKGFEGLLAFPDCIVILNGNQNYNAICEAAQLQIPIISLVDSTIPNRILNLISYPIPVNENSLQFVYLFCNSITKLILHSGVSRLGSSPSSSRKAD